MRQQKSSGFRVSRVVMALGLLVGCLSSVLAGGNGNWGGNGNGNDNDNNNGGPANPPPCTPVVGGPSGSSAASCACPRGVLLKSIPAELGGQILPPGCYVSTPTSATAFALTGNVTLNGNGFYLFSSSAALNTAAVSNVKLINGAQACDVNWCFDGAVTLGAASVFAGNIKTGPAAPITIGANAAVYGSTVAGNGVVTVGATATVYGCGPLSLSGGDDDDNDDDDTCACPAGVVPTQIHYQLGGQSLVGGGCYVPFPVGSAFHIASNQVLSLSGSAPYYFVTPGSLKTGTASEVALVDGASCSTVHWCIGGDISIGDESTCHGNLRCGADNDFRIGTSASVTGRCSKDGASSSNGGSGNRGRHVRAPIQSGAGVSIQSCSAPVEPPTPIETPPVVVVPPPVGSGAPGTGSGGICGCPAGETQQTLASGSLSALVLKPGCYYSAAAFGLTGRLTLAGAGSFTFITPAAITTAASSIVALSGGAQCNNVRWCIGAAANFGASSTFIAGQSPIGGLVTGPAGAITIGASAHIYGSLKAGNGVTTVGAAALVTTCAVSSSGTGAVGAPAPVVVPPPTALPAGSCGCAPGVTPKAIGPLGGLTLAPGCYQSTAAFGLTGILTLSGAGNYVFTSPAALNTAASSQVVLKNGALCSHVNWCIGGAGTFGASSLWSGNVQTGPAAAITVGAGAIMHSKLAPGNGVLTVGAGALITPCSA